MNRATELRQRLRFLTWIIVFGLVVSGATAVPVEWELKQLARWLEIADARASDQLPGLAGWILHVWIGVRETDSSFPFLAYGTDWLAFAHFVIAIAFVGALRDPVRNRWLFQFGMIACVLVLPWAFLMGHIRDIPVGWRLIDCSFGVLGFIPMWLGHRDAGELERLQCESKQKSS